MGKLCAVGYQPDVPEQQRKHVVHGEAAMQLLATSWPGPAVGSSDAGGASAAAVAVAPGSSVEQHKLGARGSSRDCTLHIRSVRGGRSDAERPCHRVGL